MSEDSILNFILVYLVFVLFLGAWAFGKPQPAKTPFIKVCLIAGITILPLVHVAAFYLTLTVINKGISAGNVGSEIVGTDISDSLGFFGFIGAAWEGYVRDSYINSISEKVTTLTSLSRITIVFMVLCLISVVAEIYCLSSREKRHKYTLMVTRIITGVISVFILFVAIWFYSSVESDKSSAGSYGIYELLAGDILSMMPLLFAIIAAILSVLVLAPFHLIQIKCLKNYYYDEKEEIEKEKAKAKAKVIAANRKLQRVISNKQIRHPDNTAENLLLLERLKRDGIISSKEYDEQRHVISTAQIKRSTEERHENQIEMLRNLKSLKDATILSTEEFNTQKTEIINSPLLPIWIKGKTMVETLKEIKAMADEGILTQEEFNNYKKKILNAS